MQDAQSEAVWPREESTILVALMLALRFQGRSDKLITAVLRAAQNKSLTSRCWFEI